MASEDIYGGIEAGGTKFVCVVGSGPENIAQKVRIETTTPEETFHNVIEFFQPHISAEKIKAIGVGCFGPIDLNPESPSYGFITSTPKPGWRNTDVVRRLENALNVKVAFDTDVNAAALGEFQWGASRGLDPSLYLTVGTGIGGGLIKDGKPMNGLLHPEMGHIRIPHDLAADPFPGSCPYHGDCYEGLANGPAIQKRFGQRGETIPDDDPFWKIEAGYIALALHNLILTLTPRRIILGGGILQRNFLFPLIRQKVLALLNGYVQHAAILEHIDDFIVPPALGSQSGVMGAIALARTVNQDS
jgi:fructokinase